MSDFEVPSTASAELFLAGASIAQLPTLGLQLTALGGGKIYVGATNGVLVAQDLVVCDSFVNVEVEFSDGFQYQLPSDPSLLTGTKWPVHEAQTGVVVYPLFLRQNCTNTTFYGGVFSQGTTSPHNYGMCVLDGGNNTLVRCLKMRCTNFTGFATQATGYSQFNGGSVVSAAWSYVEYAYNYYDTCGKNTVDGGGWRVSNQDINGGTPFDFNMHDNKHVNAQQYPVDIQNATSQGGIKKGRIGGDESIIFGGATTGATACINLEQNPLGFTCDDLTIEESVRTVGGGYGLLCSGGYRNLRINGTFTKAARSGISFGAANGSVNTDVYFGRIKSFNNNQAGATTNTDSSGIQLGIVSGGSGTHRRVIFSSDVQCNDDQNYIGVDGTAAAPPNAASNLVIPVFDNMTLAATGATGLSVTYVDPSGKATVLVAAGTSFTATAVAKGGYLVITNTTAGTWTATLPTITNPFLNGTNTQRSGVTLINATVNGNIIDLKFYCDPASFVGNVQTGATIAAPTGASQPLNIVTGNGNWVDAQFIIPIRTLQRSETGSADASVLSFTPVGASSWDITYSVTVVSGTNGVVSLTASYHDANNTAKTNLALPLFQQGTAAPNTTFTTSLAGEYGGTFPIDVSNSQSPILIKWVGGGTIVAFVTVTLRQRC